MINYLSLKDFKSIKSIDIALSNLNFLFGNNSVGKSSLIQSLLLLRQGYFNNNSLTQLKLNGPLVNFGRIQDIINDTSETYEIKYKVKFDINGELIATYHDKAFKQLQPSTTNVYNDMLVCENPKITGKFDEFNLFNNRFVYLNAQHVSPSFDYDIKNWENNQINKLGNYGEFVFPHIEINKDKVLSSVFKYNSDTSCNFSDIINLWLGRISKGIEINVHTNNITGKAIVSYNYRYTNGVRSSVRNPLNVGYGITHIIALIYALITSDKNSLLIIENPESHLHPKAQTAIGILIALAAKNGAQIICETHSDHIINAIRVSVKDNIISNSLCNIMFFLQDDDYNTNCKIIDIDKNGNFDEYPIGFLDEWDNALIKLL